MVTTPNEAKKPLRETRLRNFREVLLCSVRNRELASQVRRLRDVVRYPFIGMGVGTSAYTFYQRLFVKQDLSFHVDIEAASVSQILPMVRHNLGIGFFSEILAAPAIARGRSARCGWWSRCRSGLSPWWRTPPDPRASP